jgi:hypothetical protein
MFLLTGFPLIRCAIVTRSMSVFSGLAAVEAVEHVRSVKGAAPVNRLPILSPPNRVLSLHSFWILRRKLSPVTSIMDFFVSPQQKVGLPCHHVDSAHNISAKAVDTTVGALSPTTPNCSCTCRSVLVKALCYKQTGGGFESGWGHWIFSICAILPAALGPGVYSASNRNEYQKQKNNVSGE